MSCAQLVGTLKKWIERDWIVFAAAAEVAGSWLRKNWVGASMWRRVKMAQATGAPLLVSNCPFCLTMFEDGIKTGGSEGKLLVRDLTGNYC